MSRTLHLIDIENLTGADHLDLRSVARASAAYRRRANIGPLDLAVIGTNMNPLYRLTVGLEWPGARIVSGHGHDGADKALLAAANPEWVVDRGFDRVVIGSGDRAFAALAATLADAGVRVQVIGCWGSVHTSLRATATQVRFLPTPKGRSSANPTTAPVPLAA
jgi:hypothetical protein